MRGELTEAERERLAELIDGDASLRKEFVERVQRDTAQVEAMRIGGDKPPDKKSFYSLNQSASQKRTGDSSDANSVDRSPAGGESSRIRSTEFRETLPPPCQCC